MVDFAVPFSPRSSTPPIAGSTAASSSARRASSCPTMALNGKRRERVVTGDPQSASWKSPPAPAAALAARPLPRVSGWEPPTAPRGSSSRGDRLAIASAPTGTSASGGAVASAATGQEVLVEGLGLLSELVDAALHHVADADDAAQLAALDDREVADALIRHDPHDLLDRAPGCARRGVGGHEVRHLLVERGGTERREGP